MARAALFALCLALAAPEAAAQGVLSLRAQPMASGPAVTLGDVFEGCGQVCGRAIGPAPRPGQTAQFAAGFLAAATQAAGLAWTAPAGLRSVSVTRASASASLVAAPADAPAAPGAPTETEGGVRKGETIVLSYLAPGVRLTARARALHDANAGASVRVVNLTSNRTLEAVVTGPGAASVATP